MTDAPMRTVMDVDTGIDDAIAIALALASPNVELIGVSTVAGNVELPHTTANTIRVLDFLGATHVPVYRGMSRPLDRPLHNAAWVMGADGLGAAHLPPATREQEAKSGPQFLADAARAEPGVLTFICVGPLTNLAVAVALEPELPRLVRRLVIMGGAFAVPGNTTPAAEFNIFADPQAAAQVHAAGFNATWVGLDVTHQTRFDRSHWESLAGATDPRAALVYQAGRQMFSHGDRATNALHDPLAVAVAIDPSLVEDPETTFAVDAGFSMNAGKTLLGRPDRHETDPNIGQYPGRVARTVDANRFAALFADTLGL